MNSIWFDNEDTACHVNLWNAIYLVTEKWDYVVSHFKWMTSHVFLTQISIRSIINVKKIYKMGKFIADRKLST